jgi:ABC-type molybdenum transport system ATPase subunit/photorepair protein PhrA
LVASDDRVRRVMVVGCDGSGKSTLTRYVWDFPTKHRPRIVSAIERFGANLRLFHLCGDRDVKYFLAMAGAA